MSDARLKLRRTYRRLLGDLLFRIDFGDEPVRSGVHSLSLSLSFLMDETLDGFARMPTPGRWHEDYMFYSAWEYEPVAELDRLFMQQLQRVGPQHANSAQSLASIPQQPEWPEIVANVREAVRRMEHEDALRGNPHPNDDDLKL
jgi:hypothetical protein